MAYKKTACISCGFRLEQGLTCKNCGLFQIRLTPVEYRKTPKVNDQADILDVEEIAQPKQSSFRSLKPLYITNLALGIVALTFLYLVFFDSFSEGELVSLSFIWLFLINFGIVGLTAEKAVSILLNGEAATFKEAIAKTRLGSPLLLTTMHTVTNISSPLLLSLFSSFVGLLLLVAFFVGIFPSL